MTDFDVSALREAISTANPGAPVLSRVQAEGLLNALERTEREFNAWKITADERSFTALGKRLVEAEVDRDQWRRYAEVQRKLVDEADFARRKAEYRAANGGVEAADAWDEGREALQKELMRSWSMYDQGPTTPNPYRNEDK